nr:DUF3795 domain-containing protein [Candidatus Njordarchaeota archaeon]
MNEKSLIAYCGLYCGDCFNYKGEIANLAKELRAKLKEEKLDQVSQALSGDFKEFKNFEQCYQVLGALVKLRCKRACRVGGGPASCRIRNCCRDKKFQGCWECRDFGLCSRLDFLKPLYDDTHLRNIRKIRKRGIDGFLRRRIH